MNKKRIIQIITIITIIIFLLIFSYSLINYRILENEITGLVSVWGLVAVFIFVFILESIPLVIGPILVVIAALLTGLNPVELLIIVLISSTLSAILFYWVGLKASNYILGFINKETRERYERLFKKYGLWAMVIAAISPLPYIPSIAGIFKMKPKHFIFIVTPARILRYIIEIFILIWLNGFV